MAVISLSSRATGVLPIPTTEITPGVTKIGRRLCMSNRQKTYPGKSTRGLSFVRPFRSDLALQVGRNVSNPLFRRTDSVELSQRVLIKRANHCVFIDSPLSLLFRFLEARLMLLA